MAGKKTGKRLLTWVLVLVMALSLLPLNVLAANPTVMRIVRPDTDMYITYNFYLTDEEKAEPYDSQIIKSGDSLTAPATPEKEGYQFTGWFDQDENKFTDFGIAISVTEDSTDVNLYAKFVPVCYVYFMDGTGSDARIIATETLTPEGSLSSEDFNRAKLLVPVSAEQAVIGWTKDGQQVDIVSYVEGGSIYLYPIVANGHWITFDSKGGSYVEPQFVTDTTKEPTPPTKPGYDFAGWYTDEETNDKFEFGNTLSDNPTLYANWTPSNRVSYTVIHWLENADDDGYSYQESETKTGTAGAQTNATAKDTKREKDYNGFTAQTVEQKTIAGDGSTIVNVYYKRNVYVINFYSSKNPSYTCGKEQHKHWWACYLISCGKEEHQHSDSCLTPQYKITAKYGANIRDQWPGGGWYVSSDRGNNTAQSSIDVMPLGGKNFYGKQSGYYTQTASYYTEVLPGETGGTQMRDGRSYKLKHQDTTSTDILLTVTDEDRYPITGFTCNTELSAENGDNYNGANFYYTRNSYNIIFINGGETEKTENKKYQQDISTVSYTPTAPAGKEGYKFAGWFDNELCEGTAYKFNGKTMPANNITLYAKWVEPVHKVEFLVDNKVVTDWTKPDVAHNSTISDLPTPTSSTGDTFLGWVHANGKPFHPSTKITDDLTLYAKFGNKTGYSVTYNYRDGSNLVTDPSKYAEGAFATVFDGPTTAPANKVFLGWTTDENGTEVEYYPNSSIKITGNVTLYAVYGDKAETVTVTYHSNFGTDQSKTFAAYANNEKITVMDYSTTALPTREGYTFAGWNTKTGGDGDTFEASKPARVDNTDSNDLYAQWTANSGTKYTVKHHQQNLDNDNYTPYETESDKTGTTGELTNATAKNYAGFTAKPFVQQAIAADGSTVVDIYYDRNTYSVTYTDGVNDEPIFADEVHQSVKYGAPVPAYNNGTNPTRKNYTFAGWDSVVPETMPANDLTFTAKWEKKPVGDGTFDFNDVDHSDDKATPAITKTVKGNVGRNFKETFKVAVEPKSENAIDTMSSARYTGEAEVIASKSLKDVPFLFKPEAMANAVVPYGKLRFTEAGSYTYTVREEVPGKPSRMSYDTTKYTLTINVVLNKNTNKYEVESWQFTAGNRENLTQLNIVNTYRTYHPSTPSKPTLNTGDHYAYVMGYPDGTVRPNGSITRAEVSAILFRLLSDKTRDEYFTTESSFTDVKAGAWYNNSIATLEKAGVIVDTAKGGAFRPNEAITRAELAAMLAQFSDAKPVKGVKFSDVSAEHWAYEAIAIAAKMGWIEGYPDGTFRPDATITRAEMMTLVNRALERVPSDEDHLLSKRVMLTFPDCKSGDWFYIAVQEATNSHTYERAATEKNGDEQWTALRANRDWTQLEK